MNNQANGKQVLLAAACKRWVKENQPELFLAMQEAIGITPRQRNNVVLDRAVEILQHKYKRKGRVA
jgi:hypothetical protein